jgi:SAM-dependent methyltransferase
MIASANVELEPVGSCPACACDERTHLFESHDWIHDLPGDFSVMRCRRCMSAYPDPWPTAEALGAYYPDDYYAYVAPNRLKLFDRGGLPAGVWYSAVRGFLSTRYGYTHLGGSRALGGMVARVSPLRERAMFDFGVLLHPWTHHGAVLDVGCGSGQYLDLMRALGWRTVGVDISEGAVSAARDGLGLDARAGDLAGIGFPSNTFDAVSMSHTLEHVADPVRMLCEVKRVTKPGGRIAILVPNMRSMLSRMLRDYWLGLEIPRHLILFSPEGLRITLQRAGLHIEDVRTYATGARGVAAFSLSRRRGEPRAVYTDDEHRFGPMHRGQAAMLAALEHGLCAFGLPLGEQLTAVARP